LIITVAWEAGLPASSARTENHLAVIGESEANRQEVHLERGVNDARKYASLRFRLPQFLDDRTRDCSLAKLAFPLTVITQSEIQKTPYGRLEALSSKIEKRHG
jgi:hypothetical protein